MEYLNDARVLAAILIGVPLGLWLQWTKTRETTWMLRSKKREAARALFKDGAWKTAAPLDFHFALSDAFGRSVEPCELQFIESRQDPARLLLNRIAAGRTVRFLSDEQRYIDARKRRVFSHSFVSGATVVIASIALPLSGIAAFVAWSTGEYVAMALTLFYGMAITVMSVHFSFVADAGKDVLSGDEHPPALPLEVLTKAASHQQ